MVLNETIKLYPTMEQEVLINDTMFTYIDTVNRIVSYAVCGNSITKLTTAEVSANLPSALLNQCIRDAKSITKKHYKACHEKVLKNRKLAKSGNLIPCKNKVGRTYYVTKTGAKVNVNAPQLPVLKKPCCYINNQNYKIKNNSIEFPVWINGKCKRITVSITMTERQKVLLQNTKLGLLRIVRKNHKFLAQIAYECKESIIPEFGHIMGVDLGIKCPAVAYVSDGTVKFYGNGRQNKYIRRHYAYLRKRLQKAKKVKAVKRIDDKEQRIMRDIDHKLSRGIVETAVAHNVRVIKMEQLQNIRSTTRKSRKNNHSLHTWSFYRLANYIAYKAKLAGIAVEYVNPAYTSQTCPICGHIHHADDRTYVCDCGFQIHRDLLGAMNICNSTEFIGNR